MTACVYLVDTSSQQKRDSGVNAASHYSIILLNSTLTIQSPILFYSYYSGLTYCCYYGPVRIGINTDSSKYD